MTKIKRAMLNLHATSPLHVGSGRSLDVIDLPIQRECGTDLPVVPGSAVKGVARAEAEGLQSSGALGRGFVRSAFGPDTGQNPSEGAGAMAFSDARLLLLPVRSVKLLFAWVTSPYLLRRYIRDRMELGLPDEGDAAACKALGTASPAAFVAGRDLLHEITEQGNARGKAFLEDADLPATQSEHVTTLATNLGTRIFPESWRPLLLQRLIVVSDTQMGVFSRQCTQVVAHVKLDDDKKTVTKGGLWYEESLPAETALYANVIAEETHGKASDRFTAQDHIDGIVKLTSAQFGGKASVGKGMCCLQWEVAP